MWRFLIDESMPRSTTTMLRQAGYYAEDVRDIGLRGATDEAVHAYAQAHHLTLVTADKDFANVLRFPPGTHRGIISCVYRMISRLPCCCRNCGVPLPSKQVSRWTVSCWSSNAVGRGSGDRRGKLRPPRRRSPTPRAGRATAAVEHALAC